MATKQIDLSAAMKETRPGAFAKGIEVDPKRLRAHLRGTLKVRVSDGDAFTDDHKVALVRHFLGDEAADALGGKKATKKSSK